MKSEQCITCRFEADHLNAVDIQMRIRVELYTDSIRGVTTILEYERIFSGEIEDQIHQRLYNGVYSGFAHSGVQYLPNTVLAVTVLELLVTPLPQSTTDSFNVASLGYKLEVIISDLVDSSIRGLENIRSGAESYYVDSGPPEEDDDSLPELD